MSMDENKKKINEDLNSDVYDALSDVAYEYEVNKEESVTKPQFEEAEQNFNDKFFGEGEELDEALPKDLAKAYDNSAYGIGNRRSDFQPDFNKADYRAVSPEEAVQVYKNNPTSLRLIVKDRRGRPRVVRFREDGKPLNDGIGDWRFDVGPENVYHKRTGKAETDTGKMKIGHLASIADKIYVTDETMGTRDAAERSARRANPESRMFSAGLNPEVAQRLASIDKTEAERADMIRQRFYGAPDKNGEYEPVIRAYWSDDQGNFPPQQVSERGKVTAENQSFNSPEEAGKRYAKECLNYGLTDRDTARYWNAYIYLLNGNNLTPMRMPTAEETVRLFFGRAPKTKRDYAADRRYVEVATVLQAPFKKAREAAGKIADLNRQINNTSSSKADYASPEARSNRENRIKSRIDQYRGYVMNYLRELEKYESQLDELDDDDKDKLKQFDDQLTELNKRLDDLKNDLIGPNKKYYGGTQMGQRVPESLNEESLDEIVDKMENKNESLTESADKLIWSSTMTQDYLRGLSDEEKHNMLVDRGYDPEMLKGANLDDVIDNDDYMWQDDSDDFMNTVVPMINGQTNGLIAVVDKDDPQGDVLVCSAEDIIGDLIGNGDISAVQLYDVNGNVEVEYFNKQGQNVQTLELYAIPEDPDAQVEFKKNVMPSVVDDNVDPDDDDPYLNPGVDFDSPEELEDLIDVNLLKQHGTRIKNTLQVSEELNESPQDLKKLDAFLEEGCEEEPLEEAKSSNVEALATELEEIKEDFEDFGPEGFYNVPFDSFRREFPEFTSTVIDTFLKDMVGIKENELSDPEVISAWSTGELILPEDWPSLIDGAERLTTSRKEKGIQ